MDAGQRAKQGVLMDEPLPHATFSEYMVWKDNLCVYQTRNIIELSEFISTREDDFSNYRLTSVITSVMAIDDEEIEFIKDLYKGT